MPKKVLVLFDTCPQVIKLATVVKELRSRPSDFETIACYTGRHRDPRLTVGQVE